MNICVTGGGGYLGSLLIKKLLAQPETKRVECIDCLSNLVPELAKLPTNRFRYLKVDLNDAKALKETLGHYDLIIHLAEGLGGQDCDQDPELAWKSNVSATDLLMKLKRNTTPVLLYSSLSQYGSQAGTAKTGPSQTVDEGTRIHPISFYAKTKKKAEDLVLTQKQNIIFRFAGAFGCSPSMQHDSLVHDFIRKAISNIPVVIYEADLVRQFIHVEDMADAILFAVQNWGKLQGNLINIGNPTIELSKRKLAETISKHCQFKYWIEPSAEAESRNFKVSFQKMLGLGFTPKRTLESGIKELVTYYQNEDEDEKSIPNFAIGGR